MAEEEEQLKHDILHPNTLISWERIHQFQSKSPVILLSDPQAGEGRWSTHKNHHTSVVFPPTDHEGLNLHHQCEVMETFEEKVKPTSLPLSPGIKPAAIGGHNAIKFLFLRLKLPGIVSCNWIPGLLRLFSFPLIGSTVLLVLFYLRLRRRRRRLSRGEVVDELLGVIKEKDERINQLLHQIARMNELLLTSHHGVPMISKATSS